MMAAIKGALEPPQHSQPWEAQEQPRRDFRMCGSMPLVMKAAINRALDPLNTLNPGKLGSNPADISATCASVVMYGTGEFVITFVQPYDADEQVTLRFRCPCY
jgi:hypothetical protein